MTCLKISNDIFCNVTFPQNKVNCTVCVYYSENTNKLK